MIVDITVNVNNKPELDSIVITLKLDYYIAEPDPNYLNYGFDITEKIIAPVYHQYYLQKALLVHNSILEQSKDYSWLIIELNKFWEEAHDGVSPNFDQLVHMYRTVIDVLGVNDSDTFGDGMNISDDFAIKLSETFDYGKLEDFAYEKYYTTPSEYNPVHNLRRSCPGLDSVVSYPKGSLHEGTTASVYRVIQGLNDIDKWTREQIADWLESLDINLEVNIKEQ